MGLHQSLPSFFKTTFFMLPYWMAEEMLCGQCQRVDIAAFARSAHGGLLQKRLEEDLC